MLLAGLLIVDVVFGLRAMGTQGSEAVQVLDSVVVQGVPFVGAVCVVAANVLVGLARAAIGPRTRYS